MRANITTAPVFPGDAADGAAVVGMMVGGAGPWVGFREKNIPWHFRRQRQPSWPPGMPVTHQRSIVAALTRVVRASAGASSMRGVSRHLTYSLPKSAKAATISGSMTPSIDNPRKVFHAA